MYGQEIHAAIVLKGDKKVTEKELTEYVAKKAAKFKVPKKVPHSFCVRWWQFYFTKEIPKTATGKVQRAKVSEAFFKPETKGKAKL
jgi:acyl-CoA synthetase (AMP-forming)/AMP-acid ligase II